MEKTTLVWTEARRNRLAKQYNRAVERGDTEFVFDSHMILVAYAKHLLAYLDSKFGARKPE